jgi:hypothetical protein
MSSIDKLSLTCRLLYDQRVLEQRKEIEKLKVKLFFRDYTWVYFQAAMKELNRENIKCKCRGCQRAGRISFLDTVDEEAACTFGPWLDNVLHERGLVVLRRRGNWMDDEYCEGPYEDENGKISDKFSFPFAEFDCHLVETPNFDSGKKGILWGKIYIGKRLWNVESIDNPWIKQFERVFGASDERLSSPPTPPPSPKVAPIPTQPLPITTTINQGLELQALKKQLATQDLDMQTLKEQLASQAAEMQALKEQLECIHHDTDYKST